MNLIKKPGRICVTWKTFNRTSSFSTNLPKYSAYNSPIVTCEGATFKLLCSKNLYFRRLWSSSTPYYRSKTVPHPFLLLSKLRTSCSTFHLLNICSLLFVSAAVRPSLTSSFSTARTMAKSRFDYVRQFEMDDTCLQNCWIVVRIDGKAFHRFTDIHGYAKPNDDRGLSLMTRAAETVMADFDDVVLAYGQSDEYSFVFHKSSKLYSRRASKIMTNVVSLFASSFTLFWCKFFGSQELKYPPTFDARIVLYPSDENLKDYLSWRQADCHINNLYNTCFWKLVQEKGLTTNEASQRLKGTLSSDKNELLFSEFSTNYNNLPELYRKGTVVIRPKPTDSTDSNRDMANHGQTHSVVTGSQNKGIVVVVLHTDIIGKKFWEEQPHILNRKT